MDNFMNMKNEATEDWGKIPEMKSITKEMLEKREEYLKQVGKNDPKSPYTSPVSTINCDVLNENDISILNEKVKEIEEKVKENNKPMTITIPGKVHALIKTYCKNMNINIGDWCSSVLLEGIGKDNCIIDDVDKDDDEVREDEMWEISNRFLDEINRDKVLIKSDVLLLHKNLTFKGYSQYDGKPIYEKIGNVNLGDIIEYYKSISRKVIDIQLVKQVEISKTIKHNTKIDFLI
jgi:hypothetical protein